MRTETNARGDERCGNCVFWRENERSYHGFGFCRKSSPLSRMNEVETEKYYWCGEWIDRVRKGGSDGQK